MPKLPRASSSAESNADDPIRSDGGVFCTDFQSCLQRRSLSALQTGNDHGTNSAAQSLRICHCEERSDVAISQYPAGSQGTPGEYGNFTRHSVENAALYKARAVGNHTTKLGACKALRERRYTPYFGVCHFNDSLFGSAAYRRARLSPPLQGACVCPAVGINRQCLPEIATGAKRPRNDKSEAIAVLTVVCTNRQHIAGSHAKSVPRGRGAQILFRFSA